MEEKKRNFFRDIWTSIRDFEYYEEFAADRATKAIKYIFLLTLIFTLIVGLMYTYKFYLSVTEVKTYIMQNIEDITFNNRKAKDQSK